MQLERGNLVTILVGLVFVAAGPYSYLTRDAFLDHAQETRATVVEVVYESANRKGRVHPVVRYNAGGRDVLGRPERHRNVRPGDSVPVLYDARNPELMEIGTLESARNRQLLLTILPAAFGVFVCLFGLGVIRLGR